MRAARRVLGISTAAITVAATLLTAGPATAASTRARPADVVAPARLCSSAPFVARPSTNTWYRIPAIVRTASGALLAFAERRDSEDNSSDTGVTQIVESRSTDHGCTWSTPAVVAEDGQATVGNPSPVVTADGRVLLFSIDRPHANGQVASSFNGLHMQVSTDDGVTFTAYAVSSLDLAHASTMGRGDWKGGLTGPGHALLLTSGPHAGRIVVPMFFNIEGSGLHPSDIYSDDSGATWHAGYHATSLGMEGTIAQLPSTNPDADTLWISYHTQDANTPVGKGRSVAISNDGGAAIGAFKNLSLPIISTEASSLVLQSGPYKGELLVSTPGLPDITRRQLMTIFVGHDVTAQNPSGTYWSRYPVGLDDTPASYSDLVQVDDQTVGVLYETGHSSWHEKIAFVSTRIGALTAGATVAAKTSMIAPSTVWHGHINVVARVSVAGTKSPAGSVTVTLSKKHFKRSMTLKLFGDGSSSRLAQFTGVPKGKYSVVVRYNGSPRIKVAVSAPRTVTVKG